MIRVALAKEPPDFDKKVRQPGLAAIDELVGRAPRIKHPGRRRAKVADTESKIPADKFPPIWRKALDDMMDAYERRCAYLAMFIEHTGNPTVDHVIPKSRGGGSGWDNLVTCCKRCNNRKGNLLPEEAGMRLMKRPQSFSHNVNRQIMRYLGRSDEAWRKYLYYEA